MWLIVYVWPLDIVLSYSFNHIHTLSLLGCTRQIDQAYRISWWLIAGRICLSICVHKMSTTWLVNDSEKVASDLEHSKLFNFNFNRVLIKNSKSVNNAHENKNGRISGFRKKPHTPKNVNFNFEMLVLNNKIIIFQII